MIRFFEEGKYKILNKRLIKSWLQSTVANEGKILQEINIVFCNDKELLEKNIKYLKHNTLTDIITFDYSVEEKTSGEMFISIDRVKENALTLGVSFKDELERVMIHGVLHLIGYKDKSKNEKLEMRNKEDYYLSLRNF
jgi:rRNA maturation RNase YbeY